MWRNGLHFAAGKFFLITAPRHVRFARFNTDHGDALIHRTHQRTQVAAHAFVVLDFGNWFAGNAARAKAVAIRTDERDRLVRTVFASDVAKIAADALVVIDTGDAF